MSWRSIAQVANGLVANCGKTISWSCLRRSFTFHCHVNYRYTRSVRYTNSFRNKSPFAQLRSHHLESRLYPCNDAPSAYRRPLSLAGILAWLGLQKETKEDPVVTTIKRAMLCIQKGDYNTAEIILHTALKMAQERVDPEAITYIYDCMANLALEQGDLQKAEKLFKEVMQRMISTGTPTNDEAIVEMSLKLASIYSQQKQDSKAEEGFKFCLETQQKRIDEMNLDGKDELTEPEMNTLVLWAMGADWYARHLMGKHNLKLAQEYFSKALAISQRVNGESHPQTLILMNDVASVASMRKDYKTAVEYFQQAINMGIASGSPDLPAFYCNLGATLIEQGNLQDARVACRKALKLAKSNKNEEAMSEATECLQELDRLKSSI